MNWSAVAAVISCVTLLIVLLGGAHFSGKIVEKVKADGEAIEDLDERVSKHSAHLGRVDVALAKLEEYQKGFNAAAAMFTKKEPPVL